MAENELASQKAAFPLSSTSLFLGNKVFALVRNSLDTDSRDNRCHVVNVVEKHMK